MYVEHAFDIYCSGIIGRYLELLIINYFALLKENIVRNIYIPTS